MSVSMHYYAVRMVDGDKSSPVKMIMKTEGYTFVTVGLYYLHYGDHDMTPSRLSVIEEWEYDMLDAFGVTVIEPDEYRRLVSREGVRNARTISDHCRG